jgi:hypothetical protein
MQTNRLLPAAAQIWIITWPNFPSSDSKARRLDTERQRVQDKKYVCGAKTLLG